MITTELMADFVSGSALSNGRSRPNYIHLRTHVAKCFHIAARVVLLMGKWLDCRSSGAVTPQP